MRSIRVRAHGGTVISRPLAELRDDDLVLGDADPVRDGAGVRVPFMLMDNAPGGPSESTLGGVQRLLGDGYNEAEFSRMSDQAARHAAVRKKLGSAAEGRSAHYLDAAWATLTGTAASTPARPQDAPVSALSDAAQAIAQRGVEQALAHHAKRVGSQDAAGCYAGMCARIGDAWKPRAA